MFIVSALVMRCRCNLVDFLEGFLLCGDFSSGSQVHYQK